jgi:hypothetical protein
VIANIIIGVIVFTRYILSIHREFFRPERQFDVSEVKVYGDSRTAESRLKAPPYSPTSDDVETQWRQPPRNTAESQLYQPPGIPVVNTAAVAIQNKLGLPEPAKNSYQTAFGLTKDINRGRNPACTEKYRSNYYDITI